MILLRKLLLFLALGLAAPVLAAEHKDCGTEKRITIATGKLNGLYFPIGSAICQFANDQWRNREGEFRCQHRCIAVPTEGSRDNLDLLKEEGDATFDYAIVQDNMLTEDDPPLVAGMPSFLQEKLLVFVKKGAALNSLSRIARSDPDSTRVYVGDLRSGHRFTAEAVFSKVRAGEPQPEGAGSAQEDPLWFLDVKDETPGHSLGERLCMTGSDDEKLDAIVLTSGPQAPIVQQIMAECKRHEILTIDGEDVSGPKGAVVDGLLQWDAKLVMRPGADPILADMIGKEGGSEALLAHIERALVRFANSRGQK